jgi:N-methylhydantoinase A/oxoprolinase/acetone carboxylase beta subunit
VGAAWLSGYEAQNQSFIISDIGGTTTDIAVMQAGKVQLNLDGAQVGSFRTMVQAVDVTTEGLGGDTAVEINDLRQLIFASYKAVPLSLLAVRQPEVLIQLEQQLQDSMIDSMHGSFVLLPFASQSKAFLLPRDASEQERSVLNTLLAEHPKPLPLRQLARSSSAQRAIKKLVGAGTIQIAQITPSDAAHVTGQQQNWSAQAARLGLLIACKRRDMSTPTMELAEELAQQIVSETVRRSCQAVLRCALPPEISVSTPILRAVSEGKPRQGLVKLGVQLALPLLAVGGPARVYYPAVGERLQTPLHFVTHAEVANAVGAAVAPIREHRHAVVLGDGSGVFRLQSNFANEVFQEPRQALDRAWQLMRADIVQAVRAYGSAFDGLETSDLMWSQEEQRVMLPMARDENDLKFLLEVKLSLEARCYLI